MRIKKRKILEGVDRKNVSTFQRVFHNAMSDLMDEFKGIGIDTDDLDFKHDLEDQMEDFLDAYFDGKEYKKAYYGESLNEMARMPDRINPKLQKGTKVKLSPKAFKLYGNNSVSISDGLLDLKGKVGTVEGYDIDWVPEKMIHIRVDFDGTEWNFGPQDLVVVEEESLLTEKQWKHQLSNGMEIRQAIEDEDYHALRKALLAAYSEIHDMMPDEFDDKDYDDAMSEIDLLDTKPDEDADITAEDLEDSWNYELSDFYDLCDALDIWIPLNESLNEDEVEGKWAVYDSYSEELVDVYDTKEYAKEMVRHLHELQDNGMFVSWKGPFFAEPYYESLTEDTDGDALDEINDKFIGAYDNDEPHDDDYEEEEVTEYDT